MGAIPHLGTCLREATTKAITGAVDDQRGDRDLGRGSSRAAGFDAAVRPVIRGRGEVIRRCEVELCIVVDGPWRGGVERSPF
jgi:hypothetical protein